MKKRIGIAISDIDQKIAFPLKQSRIKNLLNTKKNC